MPLERTQALEDEVPDKGGVFDITFPVLVQCYVLNELVGLLANLLHLIHKFVQGIAEKSFLFHCKRHHAAVREDS